MLQPGSAVGRRGSAGAHERRAGVAVDGGKGQHAAAELGQAAARAAGILRQGVKNRVVAVGVDLGAAGLDEGVERAPVVREEVAVVTAARGLQRAAVEVNVGRRATVVVDGGHGQHAAVEVQIRSAKRVIIGTHRGTAIIAHPEIIGLHQAVALNDQGAGAARRHVDDAPVGPIAVAGPHDGIAPHGDSANARTGAGVNADKDGVGADAWRVMRRGVQQGVPAQGQVARAAVDAHVNARKRAIGGDLRGGPDGIRRNHGTARERECPRIAGSIADVDFGGVRQQSTRIDLDCALVDSRDAQGIIVIVVVNAAECDRVVDRHRAGGVHYEVAAGGDRHADRHGACPGVHFDGRAGVAVDRRAVKRQGARTRVANVDRAGAGVPDGPDRGRRADRRTVGVGTGVELGDVGSIVGDAVVPIRRVRPTRRRSAIPRGGLGLGGRTGEEDSDGRGEAASTKRHKTDDFQLHGWFLCSIREDSVCFLAVFFLLPSNDPTKNSFLLKSDFAMDSMGKHPSPRTARAARRCLARRATGLGIPTLPHCFESRMKRP